MSCLGGLTRHRKPLGFFSRAHRRVLAWLPHILFGNIQNFPLNNRFSQKSGPRNFELQKEFAYLVQGQFSVEEYYTKFKALVDELANYQSIPYCKCPCTRGAQRITSDLGDHD